MNHKVKEWHQALINHAAQCRASRPVPGREILSWPRVQQMLIIRGSLLSWFKNLQSAVSSGPGHHNGQGVSIIFTSSAPGLAAVKEIGQEANLPIISLFPDELSGFLRSHPDNSYRYHVHIWSHFLEGIANGSEKNAGDYPLNAKERYWLHVEGIMRGALLGRGVEHLWSWDGRQAKLLKKSFRHWAT